MFFRAPEGVFKSTLLDLPWLNHGFGSRHADGWPGQYISLKQIHSDIVGKLDIDGDCTGRGDALTTHVMDRWIGVRTADCVPILIADPEQRAVAAVHAGWRGTVANIAGKAVSALAERYKSNPKDLQAAIGPSIGHCCFEVGAEVAEQFQRLFPEALSLRHVDLAEANRRLLVGAGMAAGNIDLSGLCTMCGSADFHSYRRDKELSGRMVTAVRIKGS